MAKNRFFNKLSVSYHNPKAEILSNRIERLRPPPRPVPLATICASLTGFVGLFGAFFFSFGMIFVWLFSIGLHPIDQWRLSRSYATAPAVIEEALDTGSSVDDIQVYQYRFSYTPGDGGPLYGDCYTTGKRWITGASVLAHYLPGKPEVACLEGARLSKFSPRYLPFILIFPLVGLSLFLPSIFSGWRKIKLLRYGEITGALNISVSPTNTSINNVPVMEYSYEFRDRLGAVYTGTSKSLPTKKIGDEEREPVLYLPSNPRRSMLVDALPLRFALEVDEGGRWRHRGFFKPILLFLLAWGLVLAHVVIGFTIL